MNLFIFAYCLLWDVWKQRREQEEVLQFMVDDYGVVAIF
jgi:hypothetical protein